MGALGGQQVILEPPGLTRMPTMASYSLIWGRKHHSRPDPDDHFEDTMKPLAMMVLLALFAALVWWKFGFWWT